MPPDPSVPQSRRSVQLAISVQRPLTSQLPLARLPQPLPVDDSPGPDPRLALDPVRCARFANPLPGQPHGQHVGHEASAHESPSLPAVCANFLSTFQSCHSFVSWPIPRTSCRRQRELPIVVRSGQKPPVHRDSSLPTRHVRALPSTGRLHATVRRHDQSAIAQYWSTPSAYLVSFATLPPGMRSAHVPVHWHHFQSWSVLLPVFGEDLPLSGSALPWRDELADWSHAERLKRQWPNFPSCYAAPFHFRLSQWQIWRTISISAPDGPTWIDALAHEAYPACFHTL